MKNIAFTFGAIVFTLGMIGNNVILGEDVKADKNVVAVVNGEEVKRDMLADLLIDMYGNEGLGLLIRRTLVKQESIKRNVTVTEEEIGRAHVELQSLAYLVCRLLLEKKKKKLHIKYSLNNHSI